VLSQREREIMDQFLELSQAFYIATVVLLLFLSWRILYSCWISPTQRYQKLRRNGFKGPTPSFPLGNTREMTKKDGNSSLGSSNASHDIHSMVFPYFARWQKSHGEKILQTLKTPSYIYTLSILNQYFFFRALYIYALDFV
jgi:hypothetical protein